jgi:general secretion pathway protein K
MKAPARRSGFALMAALWLVVLVGVTGYELSVRSRVRRLAVANSLEATKASAAADAGLETIRAALEYRLAHPLIERNRRFDVAAIDPLGDLSFIRADTILLGDERTVARAYDAGARLQINRATEDDVRRLLAALAIEASDADRLAQRILDWRDADDLRRGRGAERDDYLHNGARALPSNAYFESVDELRDVEGMTDETYARIAPFLSTLGRGQINANEAPRAVLRSLPGIGDEAVDAILRARQSGRPFRSLDELTQRISSGARELLVVAMPELSPRMTFDTRQVVVESNGWVDGSAVHVHATALYERTGDALLTVSRQVKR